MKMGAKAPNKLKLRRPNYKCDECDRTFLSVQALKGHQYCIHKMRISPKGRELVNILSKPLKSRGKRPQKDVVETPQVSEVRKIEYECPQCNKRFSVYFSAYRHIQRYHCVNSRGENVPSDSSDLIKPVRVETCIKCQTQVFAEQVHSCPLVSSLVSGVDTTCMCMGCQQSFPNVFMFDLHVSGLHSDTSETLFFPNLLEFTEWKDQMESQGGIKYLIMGKSGTRQMYRCTFSPPRDDADAPCLCCPSSIIVKEYSKGIQVNFFKEHYGHTCKYILPDRFKKFLSTEVMKRTAPGSLEVPNKDDVYAKFKALLDTVSLAAFNADTETLKLLYGKALEMDKILRPEEPKIAKNNNMTDDQITETLESFSEKKGDSEEKEAKKIKLEDETKQNAKRKVKTVKELRESVSSTPSSPIVCFNDSYKEFVGKIHGNQSVMKKLQEKAEAKSQYKNIKTYPKKKVVKTKIGQFKPNVSPKKNPLPDVNEESDLDEVSSNNYSAVKVKCEMDYEVVEQENDCNILILKI